MNLVADESVDRQIVEGLRRQGYNVWYIEQTADGDILLSIDFGLKEWNEHSPKEIVRKNREFVYETGAVDASKGTVIDQKIVDKERKRKYKVSRVDRFRYRTRYFSDAGIIGSKEFVGEAPVKWKTPMK